MANKPLETPLPADLPENWSEGQIVAPAGGSVGLSQQHGYNYLMNQVNAAQRAVNQINQSFENISGKRVCRAVVGAASAGWTAGDCDFLCDGQNDDAQIVKALETLKSHGGKLVFLSGDYKVNQALDLLDLGELGGDIGLEGCPGARLILTKNLSFRADRAPCHCHISGLTFQAEGAAVLYLSELHALVENCVFQNVRVEFSGSRSGLPATDFLFQNNWMETTATMPSEGWGLLRVSTITSAEGSKTAIAHNFIRSAAKLPILEAFPPPGGTSVFLSNNHIQGFGENAQTFNIDRGALVADNIFVDIKQLDIAYSSAVGNYVKNGVLWVNGPNNGAVDIPLASAVCNQVENGSIVASGLTMVTGNSVQAPSDASGIFCVKNANNAAPEASPSVTGNFVAGQTIGIQLNANSYQAPECSCALVSGNKIYGCSTPIQIEANWSDCLIADNLFPAGSIVDKGTGNLIRGNSNDKGSGAGTQGPQGPPGQGLPAGGKRGQILAKASDADYDFVWIDPPSGGGGATPEQIAEAARVLVEQSWEESY